MKRLFSGVICTVLILCLAVCGFAAAEEAAVPDASGLPAITDRTGSVQFDAFSFRLNGTEVTGGMLEGLSVYEISVHTVNSKGKESDATYTGYRLSDVLAACGCEGVTKVSSIANDEYVNELDASCIMSEYTLLAITKNGEAGPEGTVFIAPCESTVSGDYHKLVVEVIAE